MPVYIKFKPGFIMSLKPLFIVSFETFRTFSNSKSKLFLILIVICIILLYFREYFSSNCHSFHGLYKTDQGFKFIIDYMYRNQN